MIVRHSSFRGDVSVRLDGDDEDDARLARRIGRGRHEKAASGLQAAFDAIVRHHLPFCHRPVPSLEIAGGNQGDDGAGPVTRTVSAQSGIFLLAGCDGRSRMYTKIGRLPS